MRTLVFYATILLWPGVNGRSSINDGDTYEPNFKEEWCEEAPVDVVIVIDSSGSVERTFSAYKDTAYRLAHVMPVGPDGTHFTLIQYSSEPRVLLSFSQDPTEVRKAVAELEFLGSTTLTAEAVLAGVKELQDRGRADASRLFILMTDGNSYNKWIDVLSAADMVHSIGATVAVVAYGDSVYWPEIETYAGGNSSAYSEHNVEHLYGLVMDLTGRVCRNLRSPGDCRNPVDIVIVIDSSESVEDSFSHYKESALNLIRSLKIGDQATLVSIVQYSREANVLLPFSPEQTTEGVLAVLEETKHIGATTITSNGIKLGLRQFEDSQRPDSKRIFILMTDGHSYDNWETVTETAQLLSTTVPARFILAAGESLGLAELAQYTRDGAILIKDKDVDSLAKQVTNAIGGCQPI